ncbi:MAG: DUF1799 domain-containing protein [Candidatus Thiodiazotropha lotti]|nr:DUF1799 domain-containing protein [Candidatus Thiodiazotropha lotti]MCW4188328.1 DUF1799 domain-containing protein [Candidatus Thiodiazotropha lotti]
MEAFGATSEQIDREISKLKKAGANNEPATFVVYYDNWHAWEVFRRVINQFKTGVMTGKPLALDYSAVTSVIGLFDPPDPLELLDQVRLIEHGYLSNLD